MHVYLEPKVEEALRKRAMRKGDLSNLVNIAVWQYLTQSLGWDSGLACPKCEAALELEDEYEWDCNGISEGIHWHLAYNCPDCGWNRRLSKSIMVTQEELDALVAEEPEVEEEEPKE